MDLKQMLLELPGDIATKKLELLGEQERLIMLKDKYKEWELVTISEITDELNESGKPVYSNEGKRQAELLNRKDKKVVAVENKIKQTENIVKTLNIEICRMEDMQRNIRVYIGAEHASL